MKLETGNVIELANGERYVWNDMHTTLVDLTGEKILIREFIDLKTFKYVTRIVGEKPSKNIIRIYSDYTLTTLLWERAEVQGKISDTERAILSAVYPTYKYIARDEDGGLCLFKIEPEKYEIMWKALGNYDTLYCDFSAFNHLFKFVSWNDKNPRLISTLLY